MTDESGLGPHRHDEIDSRRRRSRVAAMFTNMQADMPFHRKLRLLVRNNWIKIRTRQGCCGHVGEPGC